MDEVDVTLHLAFSVPAKILPGLVGDIINHLPLSCSVEIEVREQS